MNPIALAKPTGPVIERVTATRQASAPLSPNTNVRTVAGLTPHNRAPASSWITERTPRPSVVQAEEHDEHEAGGDGDAGRDESADGHRHAEDRHRIARDADAELLHRVTPRDESLDGERDAQHEQQAEQDPLLAFLVVDGAHQREIEEDQERRRGDERQEGELGIVNIVGEHASYHIKYDAPLTADIEGIARPVSHWVKTSAEAKMVAADGAEAIAMASTPPGHIATLILPGDTAWNEGSGPAQVPAIPTRPKVADDTVRQAAQALAQGPGTMLLLAGEGMRERGLALAGAIAHKTGARLLAQGSNARVQRGAGRVPVNRLPYPVPQALQVLKDVQRLILVGAKAPVAFFGYPNQPSVLTPEGCAISTLTTPEEDSIDALERLADAVGAKLTGCTAPATLQARHAVGRARSGENRRDSRQHHPRARHRGR